MSGYGEQAWAQLKRRRPNEPLDPSAEAAAGQRRRWTALRRWRPERDK